MALRLFVAVAVPEAVRNQLHRALRAVDPAPQPQGLRWLSGDSYHFTLQFLGDVEPGRVPALSEACARAATQVAPFRLVLGAAGTFGSPRRARVLWVGVNRGAGPMTQLAAAVREQTAELGFEADERPYTPHLTVARIKRPANVRDLLDALKTPALAMDVGELTLFRSHLSHDGARHEALFSAPLSGVDEGAVGDGSEGSSDA
ncbi:MAG: RNA 2',3'-cyclic phosphodiesterase [Myxococcales bacterium]|jgi:2'-5' RNA ligase